jgi:hypothetical protein
MRVILAFLSMAALDLVWVAYMKSAQAGYPAVSALCALVLFLIGAYNVLSYTKDKRLIWPCALGAYAGTYLAVSYA